MSNSNPKSTDALPDWYDPYPEPNTMPRRWDLSQYGYTQNDAPKQPPADTRDAQAA